MPELPPQPVVFDVNVLVLAVTGPSATFAAWPTLPPRTDNACADCVGVVNDAREFALWLSPHILDNTARVLKELGVSADLVTEYLDMLHEIVVASGGQVMDPPRTVHDVPDFEDNLILDLAVVASAMLVVSEDTDLTAMSPWHGVPIVRPREFANRVDVMRRSAGRRR